MRYKEIRMRLLAAQSAGQAAAIARETGVELSTEQAEKLFQEIQSRRAAEMNTLDPGELEAVSGGRCDLPGVCKATVEADEIQYQDGAISKVLTSSWCWWGTDYCSYTTETYSDTGIEFGHLYPD